MGFETKVRGLILELLEPFLEKSIKDREMIYKMEKESDKHKDRINLLEVTVYKQDSVSGKTMFDDISDKILGLTVANNKARVEIIEDLNAQTTEIKNKMFDFKQRLMKVELYKEQIDANRLSIREILEHTKAQILDVRESQEKEKMKSLKDYQRMQ